MNKKKDKKFNIQRMTITGTTIIILLASLLYIINYYEAPAMLKQYLESCIHPAIFISLMLILPLMGVPISIFLILVGIKFGAIEGILLSAVAMLWHMAVTYFLVHSFLRKRLTALLQPYNVSIPKLKNGKNRWPAFIFMLIPGLPYAVKNYLLAMAEVGFVPYMFINWTAQFGISIPFIILGSAVLKMNLSMLMSALFLFLAGYLIQHYLRKKFSTREWGDKENEG